ncbi:low-density lipoprotein receptor-related protein 1-like isoform X3 [Mercenaria mercenaria]|uniref:low-density lipoprotein receptor-related protein 1-like isoform X3 n=1 Tax=Mercenaria mercenaria TaxID=6596 RepID=UPI00234E4192|nr:low-density lipoprotein receptor-related protein 1-like isoform X3 [Mercenaria mercenaria]
MGYLTHMDRYTAALLVIGMYAWCYGQSAVKSSWPKEHGLIFTISNRYGGFQRTKVKLRHLPIYPGYENFSGRVPGINLSNPNSHFLSIDVDYRTKCIYMYDYHLRSIVVGIGYSKDLNMSNMEFKHMHVGVSRGNIQVAVDWLSHTVYWTDTVFRWIVAAPGQKSKIDMDYYKIIADIHLDKPDGLTVDPLEGYLFWSDNGKHPKIERSDLMGMSRHTIYSKYLVSPLTLEADIFGKRIYWIDSEQQSILSSTYNGEDVISIRRIPNSMLFDLAIFREVIYINDVRGTVYTLNKTKGIRLGVQESTTISFFPERVYGIAVYGDENQPLKDKDYCAEKNCDHLCISTKTGAECVCSEGYKKNETSGKCQELNEGFLKAIVVANRTHLCLTDIRSLAQAEYDYVCKFTVSKQFTDTSTPSPARRKKRKALTSTLPTASTTTARLKYSSTPWLTTSTTTMSTAMPDSLSKAWPRFISTTSQTRPATSQTVVKTAIPLTEEPVDFIKMFDMDMENRIFFFATEGNTIYKRPIDLPIENNVKETIVKPTGIITGLAYDAEDTDNLYWCESNTNSVWVVNVVTRASKVIYNNISNPKDIVVLLEHRMLAMITGTNEDMYIKTMTIDGLNVKNITRGRQKISAFTFDSNKNLFYYMVDGYMGRYKNMYSISFDTKSTHLIFYPVHANASNVFVYQNYLVWIHPTNTGGRYVSSYTLNSRRNGESNYKYRIIGNTSVDIVDMKGLDKRLQSTNITSPCAYEDGGCSQICITHYTNDEMTPVCECRLGYILDKDNVTCSSTIVDDNFLVVADLKNKKLLQISLENGNISAMPNSDNDDYRGVFIDVDTKKIIWSENHDGNIYTANLNGTDQQTLKDIGDSGYPYRFDKDMTTGNLYFTTYYHSFIGVLTPSGDFFALNVAYLWIIPGDIVVHPGKGFMYYTTYNRPYVGRADMDGKNSVKLIQGNHVEKPEGLTIDFINDHLYWADSVYDTIQRCDLDGEDCVTIVNITGTGLEQIKDLVTDGKYLYYSAFRKAHVVRVELKPPYTRTVVGQSPGLGNLGTIAFYSSTNKNIQAVSNTCKARNGRGDCSTICFPTQIGRTCACENGISLNADGRTCSNVYQCTDLIRQTVLLSGGKKVEVDVTFGSSCLRHLNNKCRYRCPANFVPRFDTILTCTNVGWDLESETLCKELRCSTVIDNGQVDSNCTREVGRTCDYQCNKGFLKTAEIVVCTKNGTYHIPESGLCAAVKCPSRIPNGEMNGTCSQTIGETCEYKCNCGFKADSSLLKITCNSTGQWGAADNVCLEMKCPGTIDNGKVSQDCQRKIGDKCNYECDDGFVMTREKVVCTGNGTYHVPENGLCTQYKCSDTIENGKLDKDCTRTLAETCTYRCNKYFSSSFSDRRTICQVDGWNPDSSALCTESVCANNSLANGNITGKCSSKVGDKCMVRCNQGFVNTTNVAVCLEDLVWHPKDICIAFKCSDTIENGKLDGDCRRTLGETCTYRCNKHFSQTLSDTKTTCQADGWNPDSSALCKEPICANIYLANGNIVGRCSSKVGDTCKFQCEPGFVNTTDVVVCLDDLVWHPKDACTGYKCDDQIENGALEDGCTRTIGSSCQYSCNKYFKSSIATQLITCQATGWNLGTSELCKESVCEDKTLTNGRTMGQCTSKIGETCMVQCDKGYINTTDKVVCQDDSTWHPSDSCTVFTCSDKIENGSLDPGCARRVGTSCKYSCNKYYTPSVKDFEIKCEASGWSPVAINLCSVSACEDSSLSNGKIIGTCSKKIGDVCEFQCDKGYANTTDLVVCKSDKMWNPSESCEVVKCLTTVPDGEITRTCDFSIGAKCTFKCNAGFIANELYQSITCNSSGQWDASEELCLAIKCSPYVPNGEITGTCDLAIGATCKFTCYSDFKATDLHTNITCNASGHWNITNNLCLERISVTRESSSSNGLPVPGVAAGIAILLLAVFLLIGAFIFLFLRRSSNLSPFRHSKPTAFENPGYLRNIDTPVQTIDESYVVHSCSSCDRDVFLVLWSKCSPKSLAKRYGWRTKVQLRHLPMYPGYENFSGHVPVVNFSKPNTHFLSIDVDYRTKCIYRYEYHLR